MEIPVIININLYKVLKKDHIKNIIKYYKEINMRSLFSILFLFDLLCLGLMEEI